MTIKVKRTGLPLELEAAVAAHAAALVAGDDCGAASFVEERAAGAADAAIARAASMRPFRGFEVIARARLGFQYIVKLRLAGVAGAMMTLQNRWHRESGGAWRLIEIEDAGLRSPWKKPDQNSTVKRDQVKIDG
jgi:hypothetical protein